MSDTEYVFVQVTAGSEDEAMAIATTLVERQLVACAQIMPIRSCYRWEGRVAQDDEQLIFLKTRRDRFPALETAVAEIHSYDVPEILVTPIIDGSAAYLKWIDESVSE